MTICLIIREKCNFVCYSDECDSGNNTAKTGSNAHPSGRKFGWAHDEAETKSNIAVS